MNSKAVKIKKELKWKSIIIANIYLALTVGQSSCQELYKHSAICSFQNTYQVDTIL